MTERLTLVDENDQIISVGDRKEAWAKSYYTRNVRIILRDQNGRFLSQKRSMKKDTFPGMWTVAASGHVDEGETWDMTAHRETKEEIGISTDLKLIGGFTFKNDIADKKIRQIIRVYEGAINSSIRFDLEEDEVEDTRWYELNELKSFMSETPNQFTPSFIETINRFY